MMIPQAVAVVETPEVGMKLAEEESPMAYQWQARERDGSVMWYTYESSRERKWELIMMPFYRSPMIDQILPAGSQDD